MVKAVCILVFCYTLGILGKSRERKHMAGHAVSDLLTLQSLPNSFFQVGYFDKIQMKINSIFYSLPG